MTAPNFLRCKHCEWTTRKWGHGSVPGKAWRRLAYHMEDKHGDNSLLESLDDEFDATHFPEIYA